VWKKYNEEKEKFIKGVKETFNVQKKVV